MALFTGHLWSTKRARRVKQYVEVHEIRLPPRPGICFLSFVEMKIPPKNLTIFSKILSILNKLGNITRIFQLIISRYVFQHLQELDITQTFPLEKVCARSNFRTHCSVC